MNDWLIDEVWFCEERRGLVISSTFFFCYRAIIVLVWFNKCTLWIRETKRENRFSCVLWYLCIDTHVNEELEIIIYSTYNNGKIQIQSIVQHFRWQKLQFMSLALELEPVPVSVDFFILSLREAACDRRRRISSNLASCCYRRHLFSVLLCHFFSLHKHFLLRQDYIIT